MLPQQYCLRWKYHHSNLQTMFSQLLDRGCFCDVTLACEGQLIRAHRVVLCACSTFFDTVLTNYASERDPIIIIKDVTFADVKCLIEFMYKGEINVEHAHLSTLLKTADDLKIKGLAEVTWRENDDISTSATPPKAEYNTHYPTAPIICEREHKIESPELPPSSRTCGNSNGIYISPSQVDCFLGPKRRRGRPPLDDTYDVFNVRRNYANNIVEPDHSTYLDAKQYHSSHENKQKSIMEAAMPSLTATATVYQQQKQRLRQTISQSEYEDMEQSDQQLEPDPEWINSNLEVNVRESEDTNPMDHNVENTEKTNSETQNVEEVPKQQQQQQYISIKKEKKYEKKHRRKSEEQWDRISKHRKYSLNNNSNDVNESVDTKETIVPIPINDKENNRDDAQTNITVSKSVIQITEPEISATTTTVKTTRTATITNDSSPSFSANNNNNSNNNNSNNKRSSTSTTSSSAATSLQQHNAHFSKFAPEGYTLNEHGILMTHDFVHTGISSAIPTTSGVVTPNETLTTSMNASVCSIANGGDAAECSAAAAAAAAGGDVKMEDYDVGDVRLTPEEILLCQDVVKMDDYLAKGRRPQFWEEPFTRRVLDAIKNKRLEMKKAARILGVSYGTLYGRYREVYGCLKHPYSGPPLRPSAASQLTIQPGCEIVFPTEKKDGQGLLPGQ